MNIERGILEAVLELFDGDQVAAERWLREPAKALGGLTPLETLALEDGAEAVRDLIGRIQHGIIT